MQTPSSLKLKEFLDRKVAEYNKPVFIQSDPISIPHLFSRKQDIEIAAFFSAIFAWGNRTTIIQKSRELMELMHMEPHSFCISHNEEDLRRLTSFKHRTFNPTDLLYFVEFFKHHYTRNDSLESAFTKGMKRSDTNTENALNGFYDYFFSLEHVPARTMKHIACPAKKSTCKRLNMFLRWMARSDNHGVDFGLWKKISPAQLVCPIDLHVARVARNFKLLERQQTDWIAALELTTSLKQFDSLDPVKYDFALFSLGITERF